MKKEMLINVLQPEECRIAIVEDGVLEELYVERASQESYVGNIYKGRIVNIEPSIQAAFVDFGIGRNGFLHVSDVAPAYYKHLLSSSDLAAYEAELEREYMGGPDPEASSRGGPRGGRSERGGPGRPREERPAPPAQREMTAWLPPEETAAASGSDADETSDFGAGVIESVLAGKGEPEDEGDFGAGLVGEETELEPEPEQEEEPAHFQAPSHSEASTRFEAPDSIVHAQEENDDGFGAGLEIDAPPSHVEPLKAHDNLFDAAGPALEPAEEAETTPESEPKARRGRPRKLKGKADEASTEGESTPLEPKAKATRGRKPRKKAEDGTEGAATSEPAAEGTESDPALSREKPKYMPGAERRTTPNDAEPEITPFFDESPGFDPEGPNDRFLGGEANEPEAEPISRFGADDPESAADSVEEAREMAQEEEFVAPPASRGRYGDEAPGGPRGGRDRGRGGRDRDRDRDRDRAPRGRSGDRDRGPRGRGGPPPGRTGPRDRGLPRFPIQEIFKRGQEVIVQVIKEGIGTKGPTLSTYVSIAGRYLVLMPSLNRVGVSRKIEDHEARRRLRDIMATLGPPKGVGFIVRTAAVDRDAKELQNDLAYLLRLWQVVVRRIKRMPAPVEIFRESDMITRTIRDIFSPDIGTIWVDETNAFAHASEFLQVVMPQFAGRIRFFAETEPLFHKYGIEEDLAKINQKRLELPQGGSIIIEQTEALVAIDVNSGNFRAENDAEETAYRLNLIAAKEIARQLRLRDLGGVIINDFIDMRREEHRRNVERALRDALRRDRARTKILRISQFGLIEMTRQRIQPSLKKRVYNDCPHCKGSGYVKTSETLSIDVMRMLQLVAHRTPTIQNVQISVHAEVAHYLLNKKRKEITALEERGKIEIAINGLQGVSPDTLEFKCFDQNGSEVRLLPAIVPRLAGGRRGPSERRYPQPLD